MTFLKQFLCGVLVLAGVEGAQATEAPLTIEQTIAKTEAYLNSITTLSATFHQYNEDGSRSHGRFYLLRPGRLRLQYANPSSLLVVANGEYLITHDPAQGEPISIPIDSTPASFILRKTVRFSGDVHVTRIQPHVGGMSITVVKKEAPEEGSLSLVFQDGPFRLTQWRVVDNQGNVTQVALSDIKLNRALDPSLFIL